jgi:hypothetical protein
MDLRRRHATALLAGLATGLATNRPASAQATDDQVRKRLRADRSPDTTTRWRRA